MKEKILGYDQIELNKLDIKLDELLILRYFTDFQKLDKKGNSKMRKFIVDDKDYYWLSYTKVIEDLPILKLVNNNAVARKLNKLCKVNVLEKELVRTPDFPYTVFRHGEAYPKLIHQHKPDKVKPKNKPIRPYDEIIKHLNEKAGTNFRKVFSIVDLIDKLYLAGYTLEDIKHVINVKSEQWLNNEVMKNNLNPRTLFNLDKGYFQKYVKEKLKKKESVSVLKATII